MRAFQNNSFQNNAFQVVDNYAVMSVTLSDIVFAASGTVVSNTLYVTLDDVSFKSIAWLTNAPISTVWTDQANASSTWTVQPNASSPWTVQPPL